MGLHVHVSYPTTEVSLETSVAFVHSLHPSELYFSSIRPKATTECVDVQMTPFVSLYLQLFIN